MESRRQDKGRPSGPLWADWQGWPRRLRERKRSLSVACLLLGLVLLIPAISSHSTDAGDSAFEQASGQTALLMFLPERLTLGATEVRCVEAACLWPVSTWTALTSPLPAAVAVTPTFPLPQGTPPFPLRV